MSALLLLDVWFNKGGRVEQDCKMITEDFETLHTKQCALIDITSISYLKETPYLLQPVTSNALFELLGQKDIKKRAMLEVLARMISYDFVVIDGTASKPVFNAADVQSGHLLGELGGLLRQIIIPEPVYEAVSLLFSTEDKGREETLWEMFDALSMRRPNWYPLTGLIEKERLESKYSREVIGYDLGSFSHMSGPFPQRAVLYLELSARGGVPIFLSPDKDPFLVHYQKKLPVDALETVEKIVDTQFQETLKDLFLPSEGIPIPPLAEHIVRQAHRKNISLLTSMLEIRETKEAKIFRRWLGEIQQNLVSAERPKLIDAAKALHELKGVAQAWFSNFDLGYMTQHKHTKFIPKALPVIGDVFEATGHGEITIKDPLVKRPLYLTFISKWYEDK
jgi:hypothetical protein